MATTNAYPGELSIRFSRPYAQDRAYSSHEQGVKPALLREVSFIDSWLTYVLPEQQGFPWLLRKSLGMVTVELSLVHASSSPDSITAKTHIRPGSYETTEDTFYLDNEVRERTDKAIGKVSARARYLKIDEIEEEDVRAKVKAGNEGTGEVVEQATQAPEKNWETKGFWTFEVINGTRYLCRYTMIIGTKNKERHVLKTVYSYVREKF